MSVRPWSVAAAVLAVCVGGAAAFAVFLLATPAGARLLVPTLLTHITGARAVTIHHISGTLAGDLLLNQLTLRETPHLPAGSVVMVRALRVSRTGWRLNGLALDAEETILTVPSKVSVVTVNRVQGQLFQQLSFRDIRLEGIQGLPPGSVLDVQRIDVVGLLRQPPSLQTLAIDVFNGRLGLPESDRIVFSGALQDGRVEAALYASHLSVGEILKAFSTSSAARWLSGSVEDADLRITGMWTDPAIHGAFRVRSLSHGRLTLTDCPVTASLRVQGLPVLPQLHGELAVRSGNVASSTTVVALQPSRLLFTGDPGTPSYDLRGSSTVARTAITVTLKGTLQQPELHLTSQPPMAEEWLLIMLATGKSWEGGGETLSQGRVSTELAADFVDYFVFGGSGSRLAQRFGISNLALTYDPERKRVGVTTTIADRVALIAETNQPEAAAGPDRTQPGQPAAPVTYTVGAEYQLTDTASVELEGERAVSPARPTPTGTDSSAATTAPQTQTADSVLLKIKKRF